jgi:hypothetical protein
MHRYNVGGFLTRFKRSRRPRFFFYRAQQQSQAAKYHTRFVAICPRLSAHLTQFLSAAACFNSLLSLLLLLPFCSSSASEAVNLVDPLRKKEEGIAARGTRRRRCYILQFDQCESMHLEAGIGRGEEKESTSPPPFCLLW